MARETSEVVRDALGSVVREALKSAGSAAPSPMKKKSSPFSGARGVAAGMGLAAAAPIAKKGFDSARGNGGGGGLPSLSSMKPGNLLSKAGDMVGDKVKQTVSMKVDQAGGAGGIAKDAASGLLPSLGGGGGDDEAAGHKGGTPGVGKGRRMPIQQSVDVGVPIETAYNQFTQFDEWPTFMHRVTNVSQEDETTVKFSTKIWTRKREFEATIVTQRPDERIKWRVSQGITHTGVVTFHELGPRLTRIELTMDVDPGSLIEKIARGARHIKRAARADLHRYKAFIEMLEFETGAWRGRIEDGEVVEEHDESYDKDRDYSDVEDLYEEQEKFGEQDEDEDEDSDKDESSDSGNGNGGSSEHRERFKRQAEATRQSSSSRSPSSSSSGRSRGSSSGGSSGGSSSRSKPRSSSGSSAKKSSSSGSSSRSRGSGSSSSGKSSSGGAKRKPATRRKSTTKG
jgi:uncharacterized membrane protein